MSQLKRAAVIHSLAGFGKCSLTIALPVLSAAGVEACPLPTSVLSSHTGGLAGFTCRDLTDDMLDYGKHWQSLNLHFDLIYTGFLGSVRQISIVCELLNRLKSPDTLVMVDPCMGDGGKLYRVFDREMITGMRRLCEHADILLPNCTEASFLLDLPCTPEQDVLAQAPALLKGLCSFGCPQAVITGVPDGNGRLGAIAYNTFTGKLSSAFAPAIKGHYHGTGDLFASVLSAGLLKGLSLEQAISPAVVFTQQAIARTQREGADPLYGLLFEPGLSTLPQMLDSSQKKGL